MKQIHILGIGCSKCQQLQANAEQALRELGLEATVEKIQDINEIVEYGVMTTPALAVDGEVKFAGKVASAEEIKEVLT